MGYWNKTAMFEEKKEELGKNSHLRATSQRGGLMAITKEGPGIKAKRNLGQTWMQRWPGKDKFES